MISENEKHEESARKITELIAKSDSHSAMVTTRSPEGKLISRPMGLQEADFDGDLWFYAERSSRKVSHIQADPQVNVTFSSGSTWISLTGSTVVVDDLEKKKELWNSVVEAWFPDGPESPSVVLLKVNADSAEYWDTPGGRVATLFSFAKAKVTGERFEGGENERVEL